MKPSEMSNDELANWLVPFQNVDGSGAAHYLPAVVDEAATRLRNSIPKPVVEVREMAEDANGQYVDDVVFLNGRILDELDGELLANQLRDALASEVRGCGGTVALAPARTKPPTVEEVGDNEYCLMFSTSSGSWTDCYGERVRWVMGLRPDIWTHWMPMPPRPTALGINDTEGGE